MAAIDTPDRHLLVVDDDDRIRDLLKEYLSRNGFRVTAAPGGAAARKLLETLDFDLAVFDVMMPGEDGFSLTGWLRERKGAAGRTPVLMLTARGLAEDRIEGLRRGADDYLPKPFDPLELVARVEVLVRHATAGLSTDRADLALDPARHSMTCHDREVMLTPTEFRMLATISSRPGQVVRRQAIAAAAWPSGGYVSENSIDSYIRRIRGKLREIDAPQELITVRGVGYTLRG